MENSLLGSKKINTSIAQQTTNVDGAVIAKVLDIYRPEYRFVKSGIEVGDDIMFETIVADYPYTKSNTFSYVTSTSIALLVSQVIYIYFAHKIYTGEFTELTMDKFLSLRDNGSLLFTNQKFSYFSKLPLNAFVQTNVKMTSPKINKKFLLGKIDVVSDKFFSSQSTVVAKV